MGDRVTRVPQSRELVRAKRLRQALERGAPPAFVPPAAPNPAAQPSSLSWSSGEKSSRARKNSPRKIPRKRIPGKKIRRTPVLKKLNSRRQYLEQLFQNSPDPLVITDRSFRAQCVNQEFQRLFGYSPAQILGKSVNQLIFPPDRAAEADWIAQCLERGESITLETQRLAKDGTLLDVSVSCAPSDHRWPDRRLLRHLSRHLRAQARRSSQLRSLSHCRKGQRHPGPAAVLRRHPRHRR